MNKEQLIQRIEQIPKFVKRDVAIKQQGDGLAVGVDLAIVKTDYNWVEDEKNKAVTEENSLKPLAFVSEGYQLVQFESVYKPMLENIEELDGYVIYYNGVGIMDIFPDDEKLKVNGGDRIGIVALNSVNKKSSVIIKFCVRHGDKQITIPKSIAGFKRMHVGKAIQITQNYLSVINKVRDVWKQIITEFEKIKVNATYVTALLDELDIKDKNLRNQVLKEVEFREEMDLWDVFMKMIAIIEGRSYKSDVHRRKRLDKISNDIFKYAVASRLLS